MRVSFLGGVWSQKLYAHPPQHLLCIWRMVVAIPNEKAGGALGEFGHYGEFVGVGRSYAQASDEPRPSYPQMHPEAVEGLFEEDVFAERGLSPESTAAVGTSKQASRQGHRVADGEASIVRNEREEFLPEALLYLPKVGSLPGEGSSMYLAEGREPCTVVPLEEEVDALVGVEPQELANHFDGKNFRVGKLRRRAALADALSFEPLVDEAEDGDDEGAKIHERGPPLRFFGGLEHHRA
jgi:hypothetical protein